MEREITLTRLKVMSSISSEFQAANQAAWLGTAFLLATCTFTPLYGRLCTVMGRRGAQQVALTFAATGTLLCGMAPSMNMLIAARFIAGIGGGGLFVTTGYGTILVDDRLCLTFIQDCHFGHVFYER